MKTIEITLVLNIPEVKCDINGNIPDDIKKEIGEDVKYRLESSNFDGFHAKQNYLVKDIKEVK